MKKIGFIDYFLSEWHADNYPAWIDEISVKYGLDFKVAYAYAEKDVSPRDGVTTDEWCGKFGVERCGSIAELCEKSDFIVILSPDNAENHLRYALEVIPYGKPVYVDKTFTPTLAEAQKIFDAAAAHGTPLCSTSALRCADELRDFRDSVSSEKTAFASGMAVSGSGSSFDNYAVHQIEMMVVCMGSRPERVMGLQNGGIKSFVVEFEGARRALFTQPVGSRTPFAVSIEKDGENTSEYRAIKSEFFKNFIHEMLIFFETGKPIATREETLAVIAIIEAGRKALERPGEWVKVF